MEKKCQVHPSISKNCKMPPTGWIPGYRSYQNQDDRKGVIRVSRKNHGPKYFKSKIHQYDINSVEEARSKPIVRCSSAYISVDEKMRKDEQLRLSKIPLQQVYDEKTNNIKLKRINFETNFKEKKTKQDDRLEFINQGTMYRPISSHQFRELDKKNWVANKNFSIF